MVKTTVTTGIEKKTLMKDKNSQKGHFFFLFSYQSETGYSVCAVSNQYWL